MGWKIIQGSALKRLREIPSDTFACCVTSPPYWGLRDYNVNGQIGLESSVDEYIQRLVKVFREVRRTLKPDGTLWLNIGDSYAATTKGSGGVGKSTLVGTPNQGNGQLFTPRKVSLGDLKAKDLIGVPWRLALALQADGWWLRCDVIWEKSNAMPHSVRDRPTRSHEYVFMFTKAEHYFFNKKAVAVPVLATSKERSRYSFHDTRTRGAVAAAQKETKSLSVAKLGAPKRMIPANETRNIRSVWSLPTGRFAGAHFAVMPASLATLCIKASCPEGGRVLDPFAGAGTTGLAAKRLGFSFTGIELNPKYAEMARQRIRDEA